MTRTSKKAHPILFSLMLGILLTFLISAASAAATIMELNDNGVIAAQGAAFLVMAVIVAGYMTRGNRSLAQFGFRPVRAAELRDSLYYIPLVIIALVQPVMGGLNVQLTAAQVLLFLVFTLLVGFTEETIFRGIIRDKLKVKGPVFYIVFSSVFFGILHMANALNGKDPLSVVLQVINAFLIGLILALLIETTENIIPLILFHFVYDALAFMTKENPDKELTVVIVLNVLYLLYGLYLVYNLRRRYKLGTAPANRLSV
ncbi:MULTISPECIES: CPBP family intramembrane glutamic endopeptidase [unclassified Paenibacillus]|uniref:CPBP family intramembrane glutamic endopeptidase n=1 Tax=unclassified Paenibacillus TaxID=185978 RepID=UPI002405C113|nr:MULTISPECIES: CPBP family intramembrane glutamic endopeptidase [unclassified Paenibacillus]MDF9844796.1 membrane protease YdiL (CAAX protease family) [Paenibacillus sp. PastF-2]MDF9851403.1 membrane protease YdiL (CAAX protease family) [Paenibacillus sp. PastM-2]MDF9857980.1 membrane protease YdiL (CAAX protease family) [Paenibacillus sp. PastF-1]MDH6483248.1 membrane protease YdiL (CAAX protease family) [Paenibacillus sp. PastH-2]MDH6510658.1 membrane protease YdiL (CAAX protease family) [